MLKRLTALGLVLAFFCALTACGSAAESDKAGEDSLTAVTMATSDGGERRVPLLPGYEEMQGGKDGSSDVYQSSNGYVLEYVTAEKRDLAQAAEENAGLYADEFREGQGMEIVQAPTASVTSAQGDGAAAGLVYHDKLTNQDVTLITCCLGVENSKEMLYLDLFVYSKSVTDQEIDAIGALMGELGLELPLDIIKK
jgi:hypothetical protein